MEQVGPWGHEGRVVGRLQTSGQSSRVRLQQGLAAVAAAGTSDRADVK